MMSREVEYKESQVTQWDGLSNTSLPWLAFPLLKPSPQVLSLRFEPEF